MEADGQSPDPVDDFVVGDRVLVKGSRRGKIAFLGETRFAPGEWAGIVLDEPVGKNDGTVSGVRYFTCEPMLGIFCRIDQLSHCSDPVVSPLRTSTRPPVSPARGSLSTNYGATNSPGRFNSGSFDFNVPSGAAFSDNHPSTADYDDVHSEQSAGSGPAAHVSFSLQFSFFFLYLNNIRIEWYSHLIATYCSLDRLSCSILLNLKRRLLDRLSAFALVTRKFRTYC